MYNFILIYQTESKEMELGTVSFNGSFEFRLNENFSVEEWNKFALIPVGDDRTYTDKDLPSYINARLPIDLRGASSKEKARYINESGLRVPSDNFYFKAK